MSLDYHTARWRKGRLYQGRRGGGAGEERPGSCNAPASPSAAGPRAAARRVPAPRCRHRRRARWYLPERSCWNYNLLLGASCNGKVSDYYHLKRRALFFTYLPGCRLAEAPNAHRSAHSVFSTSRGGDAGRCTLQHTGNKRKLCRKALKTANSCHFGLCYLTILRILTCPVHVAPCPVISVLGITARLMGYALEGEGSNVNKDASTSSDWHLNTLPKYKRAQQQQQLGSALEISSCRWY